MLLNYLNELKACTLCEWRCKVDRLKGERGVCRVGMFHIDVIFFNIFYVNALFFIFSHFSHCLIDAV